MSRLEHVHFIGIGGSGMSAIAKVMVEMGYRVSGSDIQEHEITKQLQTQGVKFYSSHQAENVQGADIVVYSSGIPEDNVELISANQKEIPLLHRSEALAQLLNQKEGIAVTGAHGKTTTSSMISLMLSRAGLDPTFVIGGEILDFGYNAKAGASEYVIAEADESDGSFLQYFPKHAIITNIEADHLENYKGDFENLKEAYLQFVHQIKPQGTLIYCQDDPINQELISRKEIQEILLERKIEILSYAIDSENSNIRAKNLLLSNRSVQCQVWDREQLLGELCLNVPGKHNLLNALASICLGLKLHVPFHLMQEALKGFVGAKRRFQVVSEARDILIVDDYAHHPTEIMATIEAAKSTGRKMYVVFQPQRYTRTYFLLEAFSHAFAEADQVIIANIYSPAGEVPIKGVSGSELACKIEKNSNKNTIFVPNYKEIVDYLIQSTCPGDLILTMGAGDIWKVAYQLKEYYHNIE
ncbi:UDP-N-acetylmuramate--L-alanine ligase [Caldalkalibacillus mannanilyticus]|uniref:UDP-N-acetylmuramate--L-alanine ligase n=1 Tax=Caldalkalibacillus mannanilyticus TaxID=1418 RepID=UPI000468AA6D|nr:UDP-N-acetylmuramate--L-alanine ligase [Caldalkalibacillus mannanilyticus]